MTTLKITERLFSDFSALCMTSYVRKAYVGIKIVYTFVRAPYIVRPFVTLRGIKRWKLRLLQDKMRTK
jgi:hypothetical protein